MRRRTFLQSAAILPAARAATTGNDLPKYRIVTPFRPAEHSGMPGAFPGQVARVHAERSIDVDERPNVDVVNRMIAEGMCALTGERNPGDAWKRFFQPNDVVGIKLNCSGAPNIMSAPEVVAEIARNLIAVGIPAEKICLYERFANQVQSVHYERVIPKGVQIWTAEDRRGSISGYDMRVYVDVDFFGEDDTRSFMAKHVTQQFTKIINVPNMKDHQASGVTGCLKNIAYGSFSNVARSHRNTRTNTYSFIGTLATVEPLRSRTVLHIMDGLRGVWHAGPFSRQRKFRFYPKLMMFGTDPVAMDRLLLDVIDDYRRSRGAISVWDRSPEHLRPGTTHDSDPNVNNFVREPGHIEYAGTLGLGTYDIKKIKIRKIEI